MNMVINNFTLKKIFATMLLCLVVNMVYGIW